MKMKLAFAAGIAVGYVLGSRAGRRSYEDLKHSVKSFWATDSVQEVVNTLEHEIKNVTEYLGKRVKDTMTHSHSPVEDNPLPNQPSGAVDQSGPVPAPTSVAGDVISDPALNDELGQDWADEGGATRGGPATPSS